MAVKLDPKVKFNALANAVHIFGYKEDQTKFKVRDIVETADNCKAVVELEDGELQGLYTDSQSARDALKEVFAVFGEDQPFITVNLRTTKKGASVYYVEVQ